jgi:hypothetical protein
VNSYKNRGIQIFGLGSAVLVGLVAALSPACADTPTRECRVGADCASGICADDGQCVRGSTPVEADGGADVDASPSTDGSTSDAPAGDSALPGCVPNKDGTITREEVPITAGLHATYKIGKNENVSTAGTTGAGGKRVWDFSAVLNSDTSVIVETQSLKGKWYESKYAGATYASTLSTSSDLLGVFETSPGALLLRGVVSPTQPSASSGTQLTYTPSVSVLAFPLKVGATWTTNATASGTFKGVDLAFAPTTESYVSKVDAAGELKTPLGTFDVLRVGIVLTRKVTSFGVTTTTIVRSFAFVTECYGTVATVTSTDNETTEEFTNAAEIRRLSP